MHTLMEKFWFVSVYLDNFNYFSTVLLGIIIFNSFISVEYTFMKNNSNVL